MKPNFSRFPSDDRNIDCDVDPLRDQLRHSKPPTSKCSPAIVFRKVGPNSLQARNSPPRLSRITTAQQDRFVLTRQCLLDALLENVDKALGRRPVKIGAERQRY